MGAILFADPSGDNVSKIFLRLMLSGLVLLCSAAKAVDLPESLLPHFADDKTLSVSLNNVGASSAESVDPFTGKLNITATDMVIPGDGGFDIKIIRSYQSQNVMPIPIQVNRVQDYSPIGLGWSMHFGEVRIANNDKMCSTDYNAWVDDNPIYVRPDGGTELLAIAAASSREDFGMTYVSNGFSKVSCSEDGSFKMVDTSGRQYEFGISYVNEDSSAKYRWAVTKITDRNGNYIDISYSLSGFFLNQTLVVDRITASDGRVVDFSYSGNPKRLDNISYSGNTLSYYYDSVNYALGDDADGNSISRPDVVLRRFEAPNGQDWKYDYYPLSYAVSQGGGSISATHNPYGGKVSFEYDLMSFVVDPEVIDYPNSLVVSKKTQESVGTWNYTYTPGSSEDVTRVSGPLGVRTYYHYGVSSVSDGELWKVGKLRKETFNPISTSGDVTVEYSWSPHAISNEDYRRRSPEIVDTSYQVAYLTSKKTTIDNSTFEEVYSDFTVGTLNPLPQLPQTVTQKSHSGSREIGYRYYWNDSDWIFEQSYKIVEGTVVWGNFYDANGNVNENFDHGVTTKYTHYSNGNIKTSKKGNYPEVDYAQYKHGVPGKISRVLAGDIVQTIDDFGRVTKYRDGLMNETQYSFDELGRPLSITPPIGKATVYTWSANHVSIGAQGQGYSKKIGFDGFGRITEEDYQADGMLSMNVDKSLDAEGKVESQRITMGAKAYNYSYDYDGVGRLTASSTPSGNMNISYGSGTKTVTDQNGHRTVYQFKEFTPGEAYTTRITKDEQLPVNIDVDFLGNPEQISQGGVVKKYTYHFGLVTSYSDPESGYRSYGYNDAGDLEFVSFHESEGGPQVWWEDYTNDDLGRVKEIEYGKKVNKNIQGFDAYERVSLRKSFGYDLAGRRKHATSVYTKDFMVKGGDGQYHVSSSEVFPVVWSMDYDQVGSLKKETLTIDGRSFPVIYEYDVNNNNSAVIYPTGRRVALNPNYFGMAKTATPFVSSADYFPTGLVKTMSYQNGDVVSGDIGPDGFVSLLSFSGNEGEILNFEYSYDGVGNIENIISSDSSRNRSISYDAIDRVKMVSSPSWQEEFTYDDVGNIKTKKVNGSVTDYSYNSKNQLQGLSGGFNKTYLYDSVGAVTDIGSSVVSGLRLERGPENLVAAVVDDGGTLQASDDKRTEMQFDARNQRVRIEDQEGGVVYTVYGANGDLLFRFNDRDETYTEYINLGGRLVAEVATTLDCNDDYDGDGIPHCQEKNWGLDPYAPEDALLDKDLDGLTNLQEYELGTSALQFDSDYDGLPDGWEHSYGLNPLISDAHGDLDGDGYSNLEEYNSSQDPTVVDPPAAVKNLVANSGDGVNALAWSGSTLSGSYKVYYSELPFFDATAAQSVDVEGRAWIHESVGNESNYYYRVAAVNQFGESDLSEMVVASPDNPTWIWFRTGSRDRQYLSVDGAKNAYVLTHQDQSFSNQDGPFHLYKTFVSGAPLAFETLQFPGKEIGKFKTFDVGTGGHILLAWQEPTYGYFYVAHYDPEAGDWSSHQLSVTGNSLSGVATSVNALGQAVVVYANNYDRPWLAIIDSDGSLLRDGRIDVANSSTGAEHVDASINDAGTASVVWHSCCSIYYSEMSVDSLSESGPHEIMPGGEFPYPVPKVKISNNGDVIVAASAIGIRVKRMGQWLPLEPIGSDDIQAGILNNGNVFVGREDRGSVYVKRGVASVDSIAWDSETKLTRSGSLIGLAAKGGANIAHFIWQDENYGKYYHQWKQGAWVESALSDLPSYLENNRVGPADLRMDEAGNLVIHQVQVVDGNSNVINAEYMGARLSLKGYPYTFVPALKQDTILEGVGTNAGAIVTAGWDASEIENIDVDDYVSWEWRQLAGPVAEIAEVSGTGRAPANTFVLPEVNEDTSFLFELTQYDQQGVGAKARYDVTLLDQGQAPNADAGTGGAIQEDETLQLNGVADDADGQIVEIVWAQTAGPIVSWLSPQNILAPSASLPNVHVETELRFQISVTDDSGRTAVDEVTYFLQNTDGSVPPDTIPPTITVDSSSYKSKGKTYFSVSMSSDEPATIYYSLDSNTSWFGGATLVESAEESGWYEYGGQFELRLDGSTPAQIEYFGRDQAGNESSEQSHTLQ